MAMGKHTPPTVITPANIGTVSGPIVVRERQIGEFSGSSFYILESSVVKPRQANILVWGLDKTGKTTFVTDYCPDPIAFISIDRRGEDAVKKAQRNGRRILFSDFSMPGTVAELGTESAQKFGEEALSLVRNNVLWAVRESVTDGECMKRFGSRLRTIFIDTGAEMTEIINLAISGRSDRAKWGDKGRSKAEANAEWRKILDSCRDGKAHLIISGRQREIYLNDKGTGRYQPRVSDIVHSSVDFAIETRISDSTMPSLGSAGGATIGSVSGMMSGGVNNPRPPQFELRPSSCGINSAELGQTYRATEWDLLGGPFVYACMRQWVGTTPEDWK